MSREEQDISRSLQRWVESLPARFLRKENKNLGPLDTLVGSNKNERFVIDSMKEMRQIRETVSIRLSKDPELPYKIGYDRLILLLSNGLYEVFDPAHLRYNRVIHYNPYHLEQLFKIEAYEESGEPKSTGPIKPCTTLFSIHVHDLTSQGVDWKGKGGDLKIKPPWVSKFRKSDPSLDANYRIDFDESGSVTKEELEYTLDGSIHRLALRYIADRNGRMKNDRFIPGPIKPGFYPEEFMSTRIRKDWLEQRFLETIGKYKELFQLGVDAEPNVVARRIGRKMTEPGDVSRYNIPKNGHTK